MAIMVSVLEKSKSKPRLIFSSVFTPKNSGRSFGRLGFLLVILNVLFLSSCNFQEKVEKPQGSNLPQAPVIFGGVIPSPERNPLSPEGIALGKALFFDPMLSGNNSISCATCHHPEKAFGESVALSNAGISGKTLFRHTQPLFNLAWQPLHFWDGGVQNLESLSFAPIQDENEMGQDIAELEQEINNSPYAEKIRKVFNDEPNAAYVVRALAQYMRSLISADSPFDQWKDGRSPNALMESQIRGYRIFEANCEGCHKEPFFTDHSFHNNGIRDDFSDRSHEGIYLGRYRVTNDPNLIGAFKTPSLRNLLQSAPYMHTGEFSTLEEVINHYSDGIKDSPTLAPQLKSLPTLANGRKGFNFSEGQKRDLILFLQALQDPTFPKKEMLPNY